MKHGSLFSGIGGFDLAAQWMGWENVFHCEWNNFGKKILKYYWPKAISYDDITKTDFTIHRGQIDILSGGFPCQPYSLAGKRLGKADDRHLWPEMLRAIREIEPRWVVGENVFGLVNWNAGMVFDEVQANLEAQGYEVQSYVLPAAAVGAPHRRDRIWIVAKDALRSGRIYGRDEQERTKIWEQWNFSAGIENRIHISEGFASNSNNTRTDNSMRTEREHEAYNERRQKQSFSEHWTYGGNGDVVYSDGTGSKREYFGQERERKFDRSNSGNGIDDFQNFPTQSPICGGDDGLPTQLDGITFPKWRNESIKGYGNAVVPQVVHQIFKAIEQYETHKNEHL